MHTPHAGLVSAVAVTVGLLTGCSELTAGAPMAAPDGATTSASPTTTTTTVAPPPDAAGLLLPSGAETPAGPVTSIPVGPNYFTSADPPTCDAAVLFRNSPLVPPGAVQQAEKAYTSPGTALMAEAASVYASPVDPSTIVRDGFSAVSACSGDAVGLAPQGPGEPMRLTRFEMAGVGVLVWQMSQPTWTCDYGLVAVSQSVLMLSLCDAQPGFPMAEWASTRRAQIFRG